VPELPVEELARRKGLSHAPTLEDLWGLAPDLFDDDAEFEMFLAWLRECRRSDL
jgi:hypothetical protein